MPTYEYVCTKCSHRFEKFQSISESPLTICPEELCAQKKWGKGRVQRQISGGAGLLFKGSGFYITDYRSEGYRAAAKKEAQPAASSSTEKASGSKSDAKSAASSTSAKPAAKSD